MRILIVEDDPVLSDGLTRSLRHADYAVDCLNEGGEADHVLTSQKYDLVILDLGLPKLDGSPRAIRWMTASRASISAPTITSPSPSSWPSWRRGCARSSGAAIRAAHRSYPTAR
jgi:DNA-binding response OmpR family regulator